MVNKFIDDEIKEEPKKKAVKTSKVANEPKKSNIITRGNKQFIQCPKCGWLHTIDTTDCRFCGTKL